MILSSNCNGCVANWAASFIKEEKVVNLEGIFHFKLGSDNRCFYFKQWWVVK